MVLKHLAIICNYTIIWRDTSGQSSFCKQGKGTVAAEGCGKALVTHEFIHQAAFEWLLRSGFEEVVKDY